MELDNILSTENINVNQLQNGLKHIGFNLSQFDGILEDQLPNLLVLFKSVVDINPKTTSKFTKMDLRSKLGKVLKGRVININSNSEATKEVKEKKLLKTNHLKNIHLNPNIIQKPQLASINKKLGKVKFFDSIKGFGYVHSFTDNKNCFIHVSKLITPGIDEYDIVIFETVASVRKPGELDAINVSNKIPVFIFNNESSLTSFAYPLMDSQLEKEVVLTEKYETGFATIRAYNRTSNWRSLIIPSEIIEKTESISFSKAILVKFLPKLIEYKSTIEWLTTFLQTELNEAAINSIFIDVINSFEQKSVSEISKEIPGIKDISFFKIFLEEKKKKLNKISFALWALDELDVLPKATTQFEVDIWRFEILENLSQKTVQKVLTSLLVEQGTSKQVEESYKFLISNRLSIDTNDELESIIEFLKKFISAFPDIFLEATNFNCKKTEYFIYLFDMGIIKSLSDVIIKQYIDELNSDNEKVNFIERQPSDKILTYYSLLPSLAIFQGKYVTSLLEKELSSINYLCFDLESDGNKIFEYAWKNNLGIRSDADFETKHDGIIELVSLINSDLIITGHDIKEFDLFVLENHGASPSFDSIWDTLEIEMLLNPTRFSYGLKTKHNAISDTELTYRLFKNQLSRILVSQTNLDIVKELLPSKVIESINQISSNSNWAYLDYEYFVNQSNEFFRPNPTNQNISEETFTKLTEKLNEEGKKVIIAPEFLWNTLSHQFDLIFYSDNKNLGFCLSKEKIESNLGDDKLLKTILFQFVDSCISKGIQPYLQHLPIAIRLKLNTELSTLICDNVEVDFRNISNKPVCIKPTDIEILKLYCNQISDLKVIIVGSELYNLTSKLQLGQDFDFATIFDRLKNEPIWLQMSGGKSFISLSQSHCMQLGITEFPEFIQNIWLEKIGKGKFKVWCNLNFNDCINDLPIAETYYVDWVDETFTKTNSFIIRADARNSSYIAEQKRVNPESLNRKIYWIYQFKLLEGIGKSTSPQILIVNDDFETEQLTAYARRKGYFIPDTKASLARQLELLHKHHSTAKLLIVSILNLDKIIASNYSGPLDFIWDSFLLQEKLQMLNGKISTDFVSNEEQKEDDYQADMNAVQKDYDLFSLIKLHKPLIDYYYKMLYDNNQDSQLFLCDTRLTDYYGIEKSLNLNAKSVQMWFKEADYDTDKEIAAEFFSSAHENAETDFNIEEAKEILRHIFLIPAEGGVPYSWHDYQHPCLNEILPAKKDLLISLPTGAGKSILFQGPALFRSAFSCKLSIVISPLRALIVKSS